jgi:hypothetical protein
VVTFGVMPCSTTRRTSTASLLVPDSRVPKAVPLRAIVVTTDEPSTCPAQAVRDRAPAIARVRNSR